MLLHGIPTSSTVTNATDFVVWQQRGSNNVIVVSTMTTTTTMPVTLHAANAATAELQLNTIF
jgi:hypothetical protein